VTELTATVLDTDVFSLLFIRRKPRDDRATDWRRKLAGYRVVIAFQTRAEILAGAHANGWSQQRLSRTREILDRTPTIGPDREVIDAYANLVAECRRLGHPLQEKVHTADRWIASCAIAKNVHLLSGDGVFGEAPGLSVLD
jgi:predicted nucleic acid-binding protein